MEAVIRAAVWGRDGETDTGDPDQAQPDDVATALAALGMKEV